MYACGSVWDKIPTRGYENRHKKWTIRPKFWEKQSNLGVCVRLAVITVFSTEAEVCAVDN